MVHAAGGQHIEDSVGRLLAPQESEFGFQEHLKRLQDSPLPVIACNGFLPGRLKSTGPKVDHEAVLEYAEITFDRARRAGVRTIVFGSSGSRSLPDGFPRGEGEAQFIALLKAMAPLAQKHGIIIALEPLQESEDNLLNTVRQGGEVCRRVNHPSVRLTADLFHMRRNGEHSNELLQAMPYLHHVHIAEIESRTAPGVAGDDFREYFLMLSAQGYGGSISIEGRWDEEQLASGFVEIRRQAESLGGGVSLTRTPHSASRVAGPDGPWRSGS